MPSPLALLLGGRLRAGGHRHTGGLDAPALYHDVPQGGICLYDGDAAPAGWSFCDGTNGTPDWRDRFIRGAASDGQLGTTGGALSVSLAHSHTPGSLATSTPTHGHSAGVTVGDGSPLMQAQGGSMDVPGRDHTHAYSASDAPAHGHTITGATDSQLGSPDTRPPFYAARWMMRLARSAGAGGAAPGTAVALLGKLFNHTHTDDTIVFGLPLNAIVPFRGTYGGWPTNWKLCDGANGTPDWRDRFIVGAGLAYARATIAGSATVTTSHQHGVGTVSYTAVGAHTHSGTVTGAVTLYSPFNAFDGGVSPAADQFNQTHATYSTDGQGGHTHAVLGAPAATTSSVSNIPAYYQAAFIKRTL